ncbi:uncharacterized protein LOC123216886 [Mangifera indica]|uniref:uncharacterized protein LOC123216886 n=1 Tax=Mangifera indica TaxID=29780 RepID=UPI001CFA8323|nr:uncharacterized protein LOC123216886 [Mangifera indica]
MQHMQTMKHQVTLYEYIKSFFDLKMATSFLVSVSVFSIIVSRFSLQPFLLNIFKLSYFSAYKTIDKNYVFLLCNGILVFIFKNSLGFKNNSPQEPVAMVSTKIVCKERYNGRIYSIVEKKVAQEPELVCEERYSRRISSIVEKKVAQEPELALVPVVAEEKQVQVQENEFEDEDEEEDGLLSREELNKKCDDFIRRMKEEIRFEAELI